MSCKAKVNKTLQENVRITASLEEEEGEDGLGNNAYCLCSIDAFNNTKLPDDLRLTCIVSETILGDT